MNMKSSVLLRTTMALVALAASERSGRAALILVDVKAANGSEIASTAADFAAYDPNVDLSATVTNVTAAGSTAIGAFTVNISAGSFFNAASGVTNGVPILDGYQFVFNQIGARTITIAGLSSVAGQNLSLTLFGAGDNPTVPTGFRVTYDGATFPTLNTNPSAPATSAVNLTFAATSADSLLIEWGRADGVFSGAAGFNGLSLSAVVPEPSAGVLAVVLGGGLGLAGLRKRTRRTC